jgi:phage shock protein PspC (stress-responsive transcriptional regulator)
MKEVTRISLAALPYNVEIDAKKELEKYLRDVERSLDADADAMKEIEARMAELFSEHGVTGEKVISSDDVRQLKVRLGEPKDFAGDEAPHDATILQSNEGKREKSLMRDTNNQILGGVCSGLAAYLHTDVVWIRLAIVVLTVITSGAMILVYLAMWLITPPAHTAAERLQMKGIPVTLEAIQEESTVVAAQNNQRRVVLTMLRIMTGIGFLIVAAAAMVGVGSISYDLATATDGMRLLEVEERVYFALMVGAGVTFTAFCIIIARTLFINRYTKRFWITIGALTILGLGLFASGALGIRSTRASVNGMTSRHQAQQVLDASEIRESKQLRVEANMPITVKYTADPSRSEATLRYSKYDANVAPTVKLLKQNDTLVVTLKDKEKSCDDGDMMCMRRFVVEIVGPSLAVVESSKHHDVTYHTTTQKSLQVTARDQSNLTVESDSLIDTVTANITKGSTASFLPASIATLNVTTEGPQSTALVANVNSLNLVVPNACSVDTARTMITIAHADTVTVNGFPYHDDIGYPCTTIRFIPKED